MSYEQLLHLTELLNKELTQPGSNVPKQFIVTTADDKLRREHFNFIRLNNSIFNYEPDNNEGLKIYALSEYNSDSIVFKRVYDFIDITNVDVVAQLAKDSAAVPLLAEYFSLREVNSYR